MSVSDGEGVGECQSVMVSVGVISDGESVGECQSVMVRV